MLPFNNVYDISVVLGKEEITYPGDPPFRRNVFCSIPESGICEISELRMSAHAGTHLDMPSHFIKDGARLQDYPASTFIFNSLVIDCTATAAIDTADLAEVDIAAGDAMLFKTANSVNGRCCNGTYTKDYVYLTPEAAEVCVARGAGLVGIDYITIDAPDSSDFPAHRIILGSDVFILEGLNLKDVPPGRYALMALPLRILDGEASPVRAVLLS